MIIQQGVGVVVVVACGGTVPTGYAICRGGGPAVGGVGGFSAFAVGTANFANVSLAPAETNVIADLVVIAVDAGGNAVGQRECQVVAWDFAAGGVSLGAGAITSATFAVGAIDEATIATPVEAPGRPASILAMMRRVWEWNCNKRIRNRTTGVVVVRNAADAADLESQTQSTALPLDETTQGV